jgi:hypothetical protein
VTCSKGIKLVFYKPILIDEAFGSNKEINDFDAFKQGADVINGNRMVDELQDVKGKV